MPRIRSPRSLHCRETAVSDWQGSGKGQYSIRINDQWRVCFRWRDGHANDVEIVDYH